MRILHVVNDAQTGGAQTLIEGLARQRHPDDEVHLLVLMAPGALSERFAASLDSVSYVGMQKRDVLPWRAIRMLRELVLGRRIELVHSHLAQSDLVSALSRLTVPKVSTVHVSSSHQTRAISRLVGKAVARLSKRFTVVACSPSAFEYAIQSGYRVAPSLIRNGTRIADAVLAPELLRRRQRSRRFVQLARWHPVKGHADLFAALAILRSSHPEVRLDCAGLGMDADNPELAASLAAHGVADLVTLHGSVQNVRELFDGARALVSPSTHEAVPMAGIEALSAGLPVLSTDVGDCAELTVRPEFLIAPGRPEELAAAMAGLLELPDPQYQAVSRAAAERARERFDERSAAADYRALYAGLLFS